MNIEVNGGTVSLTMTNAEAKRLGFALRVGYETTSRAEYWMRTSCSKPQVMEIARILIEGGSAAAAELSRGVDEVESPRYPRPMEPHISEVMHESGGHLRSDGTRFWIDRANSALIFHHPNDGVPGLFFRPNDFQKAVQGNMDRTTTEES